MKAANLTSTALAFIFTTTAVLATSLPVTAAAADKAAAPELADHEYRIVSNLSDCSGKALDEIMSMRLDDKMEWPAIASKLGVSAKELHSNNR